MPDPSYIDVASTNSFTGSLPAGLAEGDLMFFHVIGRGGGDIDPTISGWNLVAVDRGVLSPSARDVPSGLWWRRATASESAPTATWTSTVDDRASTLSVWRDAPDPTDTNHLAHNAATSPLGLPAVAVPGRTLVIAMLGSRPTISGWGGDGYTQAWRFNFSDTFSAQASKLYVNTTWDSPELITLGGVFFTVALRIRTDAGIFVDGAVH